MSEPTQDRSGLRMLIAAAIVAASVVAHPGLAQSGPGEIYCYDGTIAVNVTCPVKDTGETAAPSPTPAPTVPPPATVPSAPPATPVPPPATVPSAPRLTTIAYVYADAVKLVWTAPTSNGGSAVTAYLATQSVGGVKGKTYRLAGNVLTKELPCVSSTSCGYVVAAENAVGVGPPSNYRMASKVTR